MRFKPYPGARKEINLITGIAPVFRIALDSGRVELVGTGFWVTSVGHLVTAWHVVEENIGRNGVDRGPIFAVQTFPDHSVAVRNFRKTDRHPTFDLALSETVAAPPYTDRPTSPMTMSLDDVLLDEPVFSFAVLARDQSFEGESLPGVTTAVFSGELSSDLSSNRSTITFAVRLSFGKVVHIFEEMRDRVMLPFPCIQSDVPIYGGNSGGPLFDVRGRICAVNCTSFGGNNIAFHIPVQGVLRLRARTESLGILNSPRKYISVIELAISERVSFDPPMLDANRFVHSAFRWLLYAAKCLVRGERPSLSVHLATSANEPPAPA